MLRWMSLVFISVVLARSAQSSSFLMKPGLSHDSPSGFKSVFFSNPALPLIDLFFAFPREREGDASRSPGSLLVGSELLFSEQDRRQLDRLGASFEVKVYDDFSILGIHGLSENRDEFLKILNRTVRNIDFSNEQLLRVKNQFAETALVTNQSPERFLEVLFDRLLKRGSPYDRKALKSKHFKQLSRKEVKDQLESVLDPRGAVFVAAGDFVDRSFSKQVDRIFLNWKSKKKPSVQKKTAKHLKRDNRFVVHLGGEVKAELRMGWSFDGVSMNDRLILIVANSILGGGYRTRLGDRLRNQEALTYFIRSDLNFLQRQTHWRVRASTTPENLISLRNKILEEWRRIKKEGVKKSELESAKKYLIGNFPVTMTSHSDMVSRWVASYLFGLGEDYLELYRNRIDGVSVEDVNRVIRQYLATQPIEVLGSSKGKGLPKKSFKRVKL